MLRLIVRGFVVFLNSREEVDEDGFFQAIQAG